MLWGVNAKVVQKFEQDALQVGVIFGQVALLVDGGLHPSILITNSHQTHAAIGPTEVPDEGIEGFGHGFYCVGWGELCVVVVVRVVWGGLCGLFVGGAVFFWEEKKRRSVWVIFSSAVIWCRVYVVVVIINVKRVECNWKLCLMLVGKMG